MSDARRHDMRTSLEIRPDTGDNSGAIEEHTTVSIGKSPTNV